MTFHKLHSHPDDTGEETAPAGAASSAPPNPRGSSTFPVKYKLKVSISQRGLSVRSDITSYISALVMGAGLCLLWGDGDGAECDRAEEVCFR